MIAAPAIALALAVAAPVAASDTAPIPTLAQTAHAIDAGRFDQARLMIGRMVAHGSKGPRIDRLLADLAFASGDNATALALYRTLLAKGGGDSLMYERSGIAAIKLGDFASAGPLIKRATARGGGSWRAWNARGVLADVEGDWETADLAYARAKELSPRSAEVANNLGWSQLLRGSWPEAIALFERAVALNPKEKRSVNNLELARAALDAELPRRRVGESDRDWAVRLNDAGVAAQVTGDNKRAIAAFSQALEASISWYARAANNLQVADTK